MKFGFLDILSKNLQISRFMKIDPVRAEMFHAERQTDRQRDVTNLNFTNACQTVMHFHE